MTHTVRTLAGYVVSRVACVMAFSPFMVANLCVQPALRPSPSRSNTYIYIYTTSRFTNAFLTPLPSTIAHP